MDIHNSLNPSDLFSAKDLVVVITGGGSGIGLALTAALARSSAKKIYILGRRIDTLKAAIGSINASPDIVIPIVCDVTNPFTINTAVNQVEDEVGYVDVLINNAGVSGPDHTSVYDAKSISDVQSILMKDWPGWTSTYAINSSAVVGVSAAFLHLLDTANARRGWETGKLSIGGEPRARKDIEGIDKKDLRTSQIITVASIAAFNRWVTAGLAYSSSKAGAVSLGKILANLLAPWGIRSNIIAPGVYPSEMTVGAPSVSPYNKIPAGRQGNYDEIAGTILYLVSKGGAYVNGNVQVVDGGRLSMMPGTY